MLLFGRKSVVFEFSCLFLHYIISPFEFLCLFLHYIVSASLVPSTGLHTAEVLSKYMLK